MEVRCDDAGDSRRVRLQDRFLNVDGVILAFPGQLETPGVGRLVEKLENPPALVLGQAKGLPRSSVSEIEVPGHLMGNAARDPLRDLAIRQRAGETSTGLDLAVRDADHRFGRKRHRRYRLGRGECVRGTGEPRARIRRGRGERKQRERRRQCHCQAQPQ